MNERVINWLIYTCLIGIIPMAARFLVYEVSVSGVEPLAVSDIVAFGLVVHSANISEISKLPETEAKWKAIQNGISIFFLVMYAIILFTTILVDQRLRAKSILHAATLMAIVSFSLSASIYYRTYVKDEVR